MITQIELDGFKTFKDFKVELAPFQVIVGPNGAGKSNLFDALQLLSRLAEVDVQTAFQELRGEAGELFTKLPNGQTADRMRIAVDLLVDRKVRDRLGMEATLTYTRLHYEVEVTQRSGENKPTDLYITHEVLETIPSERDSWSKTYHLDLENGWLPKNISGLRSLISTEEKSKVVLDSDAT